MHKNEKYIFAESFFIILIITENYSIFQLNQDYSYRVLRIEYRVEKKLKEKEDKKTKQKCFFIFLDTLQKFILIRFPC